MKFFQTNFCFPTSFSRLSTLWSETVSVFFLFFFSFIEDFFQQTGVTLTDKDKESYENDLYMKNLPERDVYINVMKDAGFTDIQVCWVINLFFDISISFLLRARLQSVEWWKLQLKMIGIVNLELRPLTSSSTACYLLSGESLKFVLRSP